MKVQYWIYLYQWNATNLSFCILNSIQFYFLADPGKARCCSTNTFVIHWFINWFIHPLVKISLRRRHGQTVWSGASSHKRNYIDILSENLSLEGYQNRCIGSKVMAILLNWWILPAGEVASRRVCPAACAAQACISFQYGMIVYR